MITDKEFDAYELGYEQGKKSNKEYTPLRRFYAFVGFTTLVILAWALIAGVFWAQHFINVNS